MVKNFTPSFYVLFFSFIVVGLSLFFLFIEPMNGYLLVDDSLTSYGLDDSVVVWSSPDYSGVGVYDGVSCRLYNGYTDYGLVVMSLG